MGRYLSIPILFIAVIIQSTVIPQFRVYSGGPDLVLMIVVSWTLLAGLDDGIVWAIAGGILQDLATGIPTGTTALCLVVIAFSVNTIVGTIGRGNILLPPVIFAVATVVYEVLLGLILAVLGRGTPISFLLVQVTLPTVIFNVVLSLPVYLVVGWLFQVSRPKRVTL